MSRLDNNEMQLTGGEGDAHDGPWRARVFIERRPQLISVLCGQAEERDSVSEGREIRRELPWSWHRSPGWRGQLERVRRWHRRLLEACSPEDAEDYLYAFFQNCYHLRDWISAEGGPSLDQLFESSEELRLCRDVCNMTKHLQLTRQPATGAEPSLAREYAGPGRGWFGDDSTLVVLSGGNKWDARELAGRCLALWEDFLRSAGAA